MTAGIKYDWYQTPGEIVITILRKNVAQESVRVEVSENTGLVIYFADEKIIDMQLAHKVKSDEIKIKCTAKVEIKLVKIDFGQWATLEDKKADKPEPSTYPTSSTHGPRNWTAIEKQAIQDEDEENVEGDQAVNKLFQQIYRDASDDTKKAMMKSFTESGGTVLSTNWDEVKGQKVEVKPPDGMEYKKY